MPNSVIQSFSKKSGKPVSTVEKMWNDIVNGVCSSPFRFTTITELALLFIY